MGNPWFVSPSSRKIIANSSDKQGVLGPSFLKKQQKGTFDDSMKYLEQKVSINSPYLLSSASLPLVGLATRLAHF